MYSATNPAAAARHPVSPTLPVRRPFFLFYPLWRKKKFSFYKETSVLAIDVRNVQCVGVHESRSRRGEHVNLATSISRHAPNGFFYFFFFKHLDWKNLSFSRCVRDRLNPASLSSLPSTSRATGSKKNFPSFRLNITSEFDIDDAILRNHSLFLKMSLLFSLKLECEKLASEKIEIQRHYVMVNWLRLQYFFFHFLTFYVLCC